MVAKDKIYEEGWQAYWHKEGTESCQYDSYLQEPMYNLWMEGYLAAMFEDENLGTIIWEC